MKYKTIVTCPVCGEVFDEITHIDKDPGILIAMLVGNTRVKHREQHPECEKHTDWVKGWNLATTKESKDA